MTHAPSQTPPSIDSTDRTRRGDASRFDGGAFYRVSDWGGGYFGVNDRGNVEAGPSGVSRLDVHEIVEGLGRRGVHPPLLLRFSDILQDRIRDLTDAFRRAMLENDYRGSYRAVYPIKVNQQHQVVQEICEFGRPFGVGLEVGSKPELLAVMAITSEHPDQLILCNGFKDAAYIEAVVLSAKLGRTIIPIVESAREARLIVRASKKYGVRPRIGVRVKLASEGAGRWSKSAGIKSKFGLFVSELLAMADLLESEGMLDCLSLLHCHSGSQLDDIQRIKEVINELSHVYVGLKRRGAGLEFLDIGGGLGVDYRGMQVASESSMNYTMDEFASDVVYRIGSVLNAAGVEHPTIVTECGRAMVAHSSVLVFDVIGSAGPRTLAVRDAEGEAWRLAVGADAPQPLRDLREALDGINENRYAECFHDAMQARDAAMSLFTLGYLSLEQRALVERLFWTACARIQTIIERLPVDEVPEGLWTLDELLCDIYFGNFSVFQSLPDTWAIGQLFPVMPIHRLDERPTRRAMLADITCDSDGELSGFIGDAEGNGEPEGSIRLHELTGEPYHVGVFLVGAYQETLGDLHNLFGDAHAVHIRREDGTWAIEEIVRGDTSIAVLGYMQHEPKAYLTAMSKECEKATRTGTLTVEEAQTLTRFYEGEMEAYTYLDPRREHVDGNGNGH
ncbi:MAG: biosynthetic arginine decarboxylase [Phycisphaerales bacterium JB040]